ncbi:MAG: D-alanyl-D-alanine carboxypeptidase/D-alanyl-D-alanine-endopeptidase [Ferruginibacter sp.]
MKTFFLILSLFAVTISSGQKIESSLTNAMQRMEKDDQFKHAIISLYVVDSKTGKVVFDKNSQLGLAPASCMKVVTGAAALELLGKDYRYKTDIGYSGEIENGTLNGNLFVTAYGDPTLGSFRWDTTDTALVMKNILNALKEKNIKQITGDLIIDESKWGTQTTPGGWTWDDIGNYYGAGARGLNWHENQYDLILNPGNKTGDDVEIVGTKPQLQGAVLMNELKTGAAGSGDNSVIYLPEDGQLGYIRGTVPVSKQNFKVSGSMPDAALSFAKAFDDMLLQNNITIAGKIKTGKSFLANKEKMPSPEKMILTILSPPLDSINYWFLQKSVNLYGEAFVKTIAFDKTGSGTYEAGINIIKDLWNKNGIEKSALNMKDGSGLSPANRVTTDALVTIMQYAQKQDWFSSFFDALPLQNGIKMKSGYINGVRSYTGYIKSKSGNEYTFSFIINNYDGSPGAVREKMWKLLDLMK